MPQIQNLAGVIQQQDSGIDFSNLGNMIMRMKEMKQNQATQNLQTTMQLAEKGLVDGAQLEKAVREWEKSSGIKLADAATMKAQQQGGGTTTTTPDQGKAIQAVGKAGQQTSGAQSATPVAESSAKAYPAGGMQPGMESGSIFDNYIAQIRRQATAKGLRDEQTNVMEAKVAEMKTAAMGGDEAARQQLQAMGHLSFDAEFERLKTLKGTDPEGFAKEMSAAHDRALGLESPADKEKRRMSFVTSLTSTGDYTPEQAAAEFEKPGSSGIKKTMTQIAKEADSFYKLQESFGDEAAMKIAPQLAAGASLSEILPNVGKYQSKFAEQMAAQKAQHDEEMKLRKDQLDLQKEEFDFQKELGSERLQLLSDRVALEMEKGENAAFGANFSHMIQAVKEGVAVPKEVMEKYVNELAKRVGMTKLESRSVINRLTFGMLGKGDVWAGDVEQGTKVLDELVPGAAPIAPMTRRQAAEAEAAKVGPADKAAAKRREAGMIDPELQKFMQVLGTTGTTRPTPR